MSELKIGILDDYQGVALGLAGWGFPDATTEVFTAPFADPDEAVNRLADFDVLVAMRERTRFPADLLSRLPNQKLLVSTGPANYGCYKDFLDDFYGVDELRPDRIRAGVDGQLYVAASPYPTYACVDAWLTDFPRRPSRDRRPDAGRPRHRGPDPPIRRHRQAVPRADQRREAGHDRGRPSQHRLDAPEEVNGALLEFLAMPVPQASRT